MLESRQQAFPKRSLPSRYGISSKSTFSAFSACCVPFCRPCVKQRDGLVINIGSILGRVTFPFFGLYGASKYAVEALTDSYRYELSQLGVDVVLVQPSAYPTNMYGSAQQPADRELAKSYGDTGEVPGKILKTFMTLFQGENAPNPQDVATAIDKIVATPTSSRP